MNNTLCYYLRGIAHDLYLIYLQLQEISDNIDAKTGDEIKLMLTGLMDEIQKLYPVDY